ncbi:Protein of unknown function [Bacillus thuringiensis]|jgi:glutamyl-tRNA synthetase
MKAN